MHRDLFENQLVVYHHFHTDTLAHYQLLLHFYVHYIHILLVFIFKSFLQDIFTKSNLLLKGLDSVTVQPFITLSVGKMLHLLYLVVWHHKFHHCDTLLPFLSFFFIFFWVTTIQLRTVFVSWRCLFPRLYFNYWTVPLRTFSGQMAKLLADKTSVSISTGWSQCSSGSPGRKSGGTYKSLPPTVISKVVIVLLVIRPLWSIISSGVWSSRWISSSNAVIRPLSIVSSTTVITGKLSVTSASLDIGFIWLGLLSSSALRLGSHSVQNFC